MRHELCERTGLTQQKFTAHPGLIFPKSADRKRLAAPGLYSDYGKKKLLLTEMRNFSYDLVENYYDIVAKDNQRMPMKRSLREQTR